MHLSFFSRLFGKKKEQSEVSVVTETTTEIAQPPQGREKHAEVAQLLEIPSDEKNAELTASTVINEEEPDLREVYIPRYLYYKTFRNHPGRCPRCAKEVHNREAVFAFATDLEEDQLKAIITDLGWFCHDCPTALLNPDDFLRATQPESKPDAPKIRGFRLVGLLNLEKMQGEPTDQQNEEDFSALVPFLDQKTFGKGSKSIRTPRSKPSSRRK